MGSGIVQIDAAALCDSPWPHLEFEQFLADDEARYIASRWPVTGYSWLRHSDIMKDDGTSLRRYQPLEHAFPQIAERLKSPELQRALIDRLGVEEAQIYPTALLVEDAHGYRIRRHTDCAGKVITCQVYLADDDSHLEQGVVLQDRSGERTKQIQYGFNRGYAFKVTDHSWHRVHRSQTVRKSIQLLYYSTPTPRI